MTFLEECEEHFGSTNLYLILNLEKKASVAEVKKAYYRQSMKWHPDRFPDKTSDQATNATIIVRAYGILSDKEKRTVYDETGTVDEDGILEGGEGFEETLRLWRKMFKKVTVEDIEKFMQEYKGSEEEKTDIISSYNRRDGDLELMNEEIIGFDEKETVKIIEQLIEEGRLKRTKKFTKSSSKSAAASRKRKADKEAKEAEKALKEIVQKEGTDDLTALIQARNKQRADQMDDFADMLAAKYAPKAKKNKKAK